MYEQSLEILVTTMRYHRLFQKHIDNLCDCLHRVHMPDLCAVAHLHIFYVGVLLYRPTKPANYTKTNTNALTHTHTCAAVKC